MRWAPLLAFGLVGVVLAPEARAGSPSLAANSNQVSQRDLEAVTIPEAPKMLTLQDALRLGFANSAGFRAEIASLLEAEAGLRVTRRLWGLTLSGSAETGHSTGQDTTSQSSAQALADLDLLGGGAVSISAALSRLDSEQAGVFSVSVVQPLVRGAGRSAARYEALRQAYSSYRRALLRFFLARQDLALRIIVGYFGVVQAKEQVGIQGQGLAQADRAAKDAEARFAEGMTTKIEVTRAQLSQASRGLALNTAKLSYLNRVDAFLQTLGLQVGSPVELSTQPAYRPIGVDLESLVQEALRSRAELVIEDTVVHDTEAALMISRNQRKPSLDLFGSADRISDGEAATTWRLGIQTSLPIGSRRRGEAVRSAERGWLLARRNREERRQDIAAEVRQNGRGLLSQQERIGILDETLKVAREKLRLADISVAEGIGVYRDKIEAQEEVTAAERDLLDAQISYYFGVLRLRRALGRDVLQGVADETHDVPATAAAGVPPATP